MQKPELIRTVAVTLVFVMSGSGCAKHEAPVERASVRIELAGKLATRDLVRHARVRCERVPVAGARSGAAYFPG